MHLTRVPSLTIMAVIALSGCGRSSEKNSLSAKIVTTPLVATRSAQPHWQTGRNNVIRILSVKFFSPRYGIASGSFGTSYGIFTTDTNGQHWQLLATLPKIFSVSMISPSQGWASTCRQSGCSYPQELQTTTNGGNTWHPIYRPGPNIFMGSPDFVSSSVGFMVETNTRTQQTHLMKTTDGGLRWSLLTSPSLMFPGNAWNAIDFVNPNRGWLLMGGQPSAGSQQKALYTTANGGVNWTLVTQSASLGSPETPGGLPGTGYIDGLNFSHSSQGYLPLDRGPILVTHDGGRNFSPIWTQSFPPDVSMVASLSFPSAAVGYVLTTSSGATTLWGTTQGGKTWHVIYPPLTPNGPSAFLNRQLGGRN